MRELGFVILKNGLYLPFGEAKIDYDPHNRRQIHMTSFEDEIEKNVMFPNLTLESTGLFGKMTELSLKGMICGHNLTIPNLSTLRIYSPISLAEEQKLTLKEKQQTLKNFDQHLIYEISSSIPDRTPTYQTLEDYLNHHNLSYHQK